MNKYKFYFLIIILIIYIISPLDLFPFVFDDLIASGFLFYFWNKFKNQKSRENYYSRGRPQAKIKTEPDGSVSLDKAYKLLNVSHDAPLSEVKNAYKEKMAKSHPDKVAHLSEELQKKAKELTLEINKAYNIIKSHKGSSG
ncbi:MAG: DnaJ domain-containing protein [Candidatus Scalindua rubra]|uniref:DnaJ-like protein DjlA n=1 Tax=Candidatus Scalindua brodae TaxID=237368 RepID=A0A0B0ELM5_9BACT|nr:MAG: DnaJ-like protein DjlA [Candidatus Scalindua brodae]MBZ0110496.1 DnaJ domain-containing protein [Candidatus Scalindua rubra]TWU36332.1 Dna-J like membrane chaperone protein [Candidatus Brocadiaceae bacterium S225]